MSAMGCSEFLKQMEGWMEGERSAEARAHVRECASCRGLVADLDAIQAGAQAWAADEADPAERVWVSLRAQLEQEAIIRGDASLKAMPKPAETRRRWFAGIFGRKVLSSHLRQLAVRNLSPEIAVVSFVKTETYQQTATPQTEDYFVVDIWINKGSGDNWRCTDRYVSEVKSVPPRQ